MPLEFRLPDGIAEAGAEGIVVVWFKEAGQPVRAGELLLEVQFEKVSTEVQAPADGVLQAIRIAQGETVRPGDVLCVIAGAAAPVAEAAAPAAAPASAAAPAPAAPAAPGRQEPLPPAQRTVALRMLQSLQATAQLTLGRETDVTALVAARQALRDGGHPATLTDLVHRAVVIALAEHPRLQAQWRDDGLFFPDGVNLGFAVARGDDLLVPVIQGANRLDLAALARERQRLGEAAAAGRLSPHDLSDGTFTVTSLGTQGIDFFTPILNPPQSAILGVGRVVRRPGFLGSAVVAREYMTLSLTFDHRVLSGAPAALFLGRVAALLENPAGWADAG